MSEQVVAGWVWPSNVRVLMAYLALFVGYEFDDSDWMAIEGALPRTDAESPDGFYEYPLAGRPPLAVRLAQHNGAEPVDVKVIGRMDQVLHARVETALSLLADVRSDRDA